MRPIKEARLLLQIEKTVVEPDIALVAITGRVQLGRESQRLEWLIDELVATTQKKVVFDISQLDYLDSYGIGIFVTSCGKIEAAGGELRIACVQPKVEQLMRVTKLHRLMQFHPTVADAVRSFDEPSPLEAV